MRASGTRNELPRFNFSATAPELVSRRIGWLCSYTPEELILAAGFIPYRIHVDTSDGGEGREMLPPNICPYVRKILGAATAGCFNDFAGIVFVYSCDAMRRLADIWRTYAAPKSYFCLDVPRRIHGPAEAFLSAQLREMRSFLERQAGREIRPHDIFRAIESINSTRFLMDRLNRFRSDSAFPISGSAYHAIALHGMRSDKEKFNKEAEKFIKELEHHRDIRPALSSGSEPRVLLSGCVVAGTALTEFIEACGCSIVSDDHCTGWRHYRGRVENLTDPFQAIARRYLQRPACARMSRAGLRIRRTLDLTKEFQVNGVIFHTLKFCDPVQADLPRLSDSLRQKGIPMLHIELENFDTASGQIKTRVEAFVETMKANMQGAD